MSNRRAKVERVTSESNVSVEIDLDGTGLSSISTGVGFYDHMLTALSRHSLIDMTITTTGDVHIDGHHSVEDTAIALGQAIRERSATSWASVASAMPSSRSTRPLRSASWTSPVARTCRAPASRKATSTRSSRAPGFRTPVP